MGRFSTTIQIHNRNQIESEQFIKILSLYMKKNGFTPSSENESQFSYSFVFSKNKKWISLSSPNYPSQAVQKDVQELAKTMKTISIITNIIDSDVVTLELFNTTGNKKDTVVLGRPDYGYEETVMGNPRYWKPLLADVDTWQQLLEMWSESETFAESIISKTAPLFDMDSFIASTDYKDWLYKDSVIADDVITLYFENEEPVFITEGATKLIRGISSFWESGKEAYFAFSNIGGISKGLAIIVLGNCFKNGEVELTGEAKIRRNKDPMKSYKESNRDMEYFTAPWEKHEIADGRCGFVAFFDNYEFFNGVNTSHPTMNGKKGDDIRWFHESTVWITATVLSGEIHDFEAFAVPLSNGDGQIGINATVFKSKEVQNTYFRKKFPHAYTDTNQDN